MNMESLILRTDALFSDYARRDSPGCALAVVRDGVSRLAQLAILHRRPRLKGLLGPRYTEDHRRQFPEAPGSDDRLMRV